MKLRNFLFVMFFLADFFLLLFDKKLFLIIIITHVLETCVNSSVPKRMIITVHEVKNGAEIILFIQKLNMKLRNFLFVMFFEIKAVIFKFFDVL